MPCASTSPSRRLPFSMCAGFLSAGVLVGTAAHAQDPDPLTIMFIWDQDTVDAVTRQLDFVPRGTPFVPSDETILTFEDATQVLAGLAQDTVDEFNRVLHLSGATVSVELAGTFEMNARRTGFTFGDYLADAASSPTGPFSAMRNHRDLLNADIVVYWLDKSLVVDTKDGQALGIGVTAGNAFAVANVDASEPESVIEASIHETGHLLGLEHSRAKLGSGYTPFLPYAYGAFAALPNGRHVGDIMARIQDCPWGENNCPSVRLFSNGSRANEVPPGSGQFVQLGSTKESDAVRIIQDRFPTVSHFRAPSASIAASGATLDPLPGRLEPGDRIPLRWALPAGAPDPVRFVVELSTAFGAVHAGRGVPVQGRPDTGSDSSYWDGLVARESLDGSERAWTVSRDGFFGDAPVVVQASDRLLTVRLWTEVRDDEWVYDSHSFLVADDTFDCEAGHTPSPWSASCVRPTGPPVCIPRISAVGGFACGVDSRWPARAGYVQTSMTTAPSTLPNGTPGFAIWGTDSNGDHFCCRFGGGEFATGDGFFTLTDRVDRLDLTRGLAPVGCGDEVIREVEVDGLADDDEIWGTSSACIHDTIWGGDGEDTLFGQNGPDELRGDTYFVTGATFADLLDGGPGDDELHGQSGADELFGRSGSDQLYGGDGNDVVHGGADDDWLYGENDDDDLNGGSGADHLDGGSNNDDLQGGPGVDHLDGGVGWDLLCDQDDADAFDDPDATKLDVVFWTDTTGSGALPGSVELGPAANACYEDLRAGDYPSCESYHAAGSGSRMGECRPWEDPADVEISCDGCRHADPRSLAPLVGLIALRWRRGTRTLLRRS